MRVFVKNGQYFGIDVGQEHLIPAGAVETTQAERDALPENVKARANDALLVQIAELEAQITPRMMRDYILRPNVPAKAGKTPAQFIADIDGQIAALRAQIQP